MSGLAGVGRALSLRSYRTALLGGVITAASSLALTLPSQVLRPAEGPTAAVDGRDYALHLSLRGPCIPTARRAPGYPAAVAAVYGSGGEASRPGGC